MIRPSSPSGVWLTNRCGGSQTVIVDSRVKPGKVVRTAPPAPGSTSFSPMNQASIPGPVVIASQTCSGAASISISPRTSNGWAISGFLRQAFDRLGRDSCLALDAWMDGDDHPVISPALRRSVVVLGNERGDGMGQLFGKG